jgi:hypothetical protein
MYMYKCTYIVFILQCQKVQNNFKILLKKNHNNALFSSFFKEYPLFRLHNNVTVRSTLTRNQETSDP